MFRLDLGRQGRYCDGHSRRSFLKVGMAGMASAALPSLLRAKSDSGTRKDTSVILIWLDGGPGHMDMWDMKPDAPGEYRGIWKPVKTRVPGMETTELFPKQAKQTQHFSIVRSVAHGTGDHFAGAHRMLTAHDGGVSGANTDAKFPGIGAIVHRELGARKPGMPGYVGVPIGSSVGLRPGYTGGHFLGVAHNAFETVADPGSPGFRVPNLNLAAGLKVADLEDRQKLTKRFDTARRSLEGRDDVRAMDKFGQKAFDFVTGEKARKAFDISAEDPRLRDRYGPHGWAQSMLLARRLVEAGSTFVTVHLGGWDHHWDLQKSYERLLPIVDAGVASLFEDLAERGLLDTTLVVLCGEFGRTPKMNDGGNGGPAGSKGTPGRDHWGDAMFVQMGGGGVKGGQVIGSTDRLGRFPTSRPLTPSNVHATIYKVLGIDPRLQLIDGTGRPVNVLEDPTAIEELF